MGRKSNNHYVPNLLLRRFASRTEDGKKKKAWIWCFQTGREPLETSTRNVGAKNDFYGKGSDVEEKLAPIEGKYAEVLRRLDDGLDPNLVAADLREMVFQFALRTQAFRVEFPEIFEEILRSLGGTMTEENLRAAMEFKLKTDGKQLISAAIRKLPLRIRLPVYVLRLIPAFRRALEKKLVDLAIGRMPIFHHEVMKRFEGNGEIAMMARNSQIKRISENLNAPEKLRPYDWQVVTVSDGSIILGDAVVIAVDKSGESGSLFRFGTMWDTIYLPISKKSYLVARSDQGSEVLDFRTLNYFSARLSSDEIFASENTAYEQMLAEEIGAGDYARSSAEIKEDLAKAWGRFKP